MPNTHLFFFQARTGIVMNIIGIGALMLGTHTWGYYYFDLGDLPDWAVPVAVNATAASA